ncbi:hypothetical protein N2W54_007494 [Lotmaria passim]
MSVAVSSSTVVLPLWESASGSTADNKNNGPPATIAVHDEGIFLTFQLKEEKRSPGADAVTFVAFHPVDETCFVFGTASGKAYGVSLQDNKLFLLADLGGGVLRCGIFCPGYLTSPIVVLVQAGNRLVFVDWQRGTVTQETVAALHTQPISRLVTGPSTESLFCAVSADVFTCWEPVAEGAATGERVEATRPTGTGDQHSRNSAQASHASAAAPAATGFSPVKGEEKASTLSTAPLYACTGCAAPTQCTLQPMQKNAEASGQRSLKAAPHRFLGLHIVEPTLLLSVETSNILSLWTRRVGSNGAVAAVAFPGSHSDSSCTGNESGSAGAASSAESRTNAVQLRESVAAPSTLRLRCSAQCGTLVALGADAVVTSARGPVMEPVVAFMDAYTLAGAGVVRLPGGSAVRGKTVTATTAAGASHEIGGAMVIVVQVSALQADLVACLLSTGVVHVVLSSTYHLVFSIQPPDASLLSAVDVAPRSSPSSSSSSSPHTRWRFTPSGPTFGAMYRDQALALLHLPTARKEAASTALSFSTVRPPDSLAQGRPASPAKSTANHNPSGRHPSSAQSATQGGPAGKLASVLLAQPFLRHRLTTSVASASTTPGAGGANGSSVPLHLGDPQEAAKQVEAALLVLTACRPLTVVPKKGFPARWVDVNLVDVRFADADALHTAADTLDKSNEGGVSGSSNNSTASPPVAHAPSEHILWSEAKFCDALPAISCQYNLEQLHAHLLKYGVFPHAYRPLIWRFLTGLPAKARTASQFAALARRPLHIAVEQLMQPFPLPPSKTRQSVEAALSSLCWASPVLTLASYLPVLVYPFVLLYRHDVQAVVELTLIFFMNWGQEFFLCHPRGPTPLLAALERELGRADAALSQHLKAIGSGVEVWGWELLTSFYTDVLTGSEWLQVMDHAFTASPMWLFAFHITLVRTRLRGPLMAAVSADEVRRVLSQPVDSSGSTAVLSLKLVLENTYRLQGNWMKRNSSDGDASDGGSGPVTELLPYTQLHALSPRFTYPDGLLPHDPVILAEKMRELSLVQRSRDEAAEAARRYATLQRKAEAAAATETAFVQQQYARVAAKYDASATAWQVQVSLERARQAQAAQERQLRWDALQRRTRNAKEVAALHAEMNTVESQLRHDMVDRHMEQLKWGLATHMSDEELARLQQAAEAQMERAVKHLQEDAQLQAEEAARFNAEPVLQVDGVNVGTADSHSTTSSEQRASEETTTSPSSIPQVDNENVISLSIKHTGEEERKCSSVQEKHDVALQFKGEEDVGEQQQDRLDNNLAAPSSLKELKEASASLDASGEAASAAQSTTALSAATEAYASPPRDGDQQARRLGPVLRHASHGAARASSSNRHHHHNTVSDPIVQSFVELRNRVLQRLQPTHDHMAPAAKHQHQNRSHHHHSPAATTGSDTTATSTNTPSFSTTSYYYTTSSSYENRSDTGTGETTTTTTTATRDKSTPSSTTAPSSAGHRVFTDVAGPHESSKACNTEDGQVLCGQRKRSLRRPPRHPPAVTASTSATTTATSAQWSTSCDEDGTYSWSYYDSSTGQSGSGSFFTKSSPRTSPSSSSHKP